MTRNLKQRSSRRSRRVCLWAFLCLAAWGSTATWEGENFVPVYKREKPVGEGDFAITGIAMAMVKKSYVWRLDFSREVDLSRMRLILYLDADSQLATGRQDKPEAIGSDLMLFVNKTGASWGYSDAASRSLVALAPKMEIAGKQVFLAAPLKLHREKLELRYRMRWLCEGLSKEVRGESQGDFLPLTVTFPGKTLEDFQRIETTGQPRPPSWRFTNEQVAYESLSDKGLTPDEIPRVAGVSNGRPRPNPMFAYAPRASGPGGVSATNVPVEFFEEAGVARRGEGVCFGIPFPQGALRDPGRVRLVDGGKELAAQVAATAFWGDGSIQWAAIDARLSVDAGQKKTLRVEFGNQVSPAVKAPVIRVDEGPGAVAITTGPIKVEIDRERFNLLRGVWRDGNGDGRFADDEKIGACHPDGLRLLDERGKAFASGARPPESIRFEERGPLKVVLRVEGAYGDVPSDPTGTERGALMRYVVRLVFRAGSPEVGVAVTHINDCLENEFTDIGSLSLSFLTSRPATGHTAFERRADSALGALRGARLSVFQADENTLRVRADGREREAGRGGGVFITEGAAGNLALGVEDFWQRWPKGFSGDERGFTMELLPAQPDARYGSDLPFHLMFPFVEGKYRSKWGMAFTERLTLDFSGSPAPAELAARLDRPLIAVLPAAYLASTRALRPFAVPQGGQFTMWDDFVSESVEAHLKRKEKYREYGYFNHGDWFGERGRNWGNNEYDLAHGLFMQFARTGDRRYFRLARAAARHQADVDIVHAYPDPYYVGANHQHSVGHMGVWNIGSKAAGWAKPLGTWTHKYDSHTSADGGHTWCDGMLEAWYLGGEAPVMESALALGEHIAWNMSRTFTQLTTHERSAGWSLRAIISLYRATRDPLYMEAASRIAAVALREQKWDDGGAWPHELPLDHAGGKKGIVGNAIFLVGILASGMKDYEQESHDPAARRSLLAACEWLSRAYSPAREAWPYTCTTAGSPVVDSYSYALSFINNGPLPYAGSLQGKPLLSQLTARAMERAMGVTRSEDFGKELAQYLVFTSETMGDLQRFHLAALPDGGSGFLDRGRRGELFAAQVARTVDAAGYSLRGPTDKAFYVQLSRPEGDLTATRSPTGAAAKREATGEISLAGADGRIRAQADFSTDGASSFPWKLKGAVGEVFKVAVHDDMRAAWNLKADGARVVAHVASETRLAGIGMAKYYFFVPKGTGSFQVRITGCHPGSYGLAVLGPSGALVAATNGLNAGAAIVPGEKSTDADRPVRQVTILPAATDTGKAWRLVLNAAGDIGLEFEGIPPYLSLRVEDLFVPTP